jgi:hypothetical protein
MITLLYWFMSKWKGGDEMMAMFFAQRVILGKTKYSEVPSTLKAGVKEILVDSGLEFLTEGV